VRLQFSVDATEQIVGRERREHEVRQKEKGKRKKKSRRRVNSDVMPLLAHKRRTPMRILKCLLLTLLVYVPVSAQFKENDQRAPDTADRKAVKGFGGNLILVENPRAFIQEWMKPETPSINPANEVTREMSLGAFVLFAGCRPDKQGVCNAEVDYTIYKPDGSIFVEREHQPLWKDRAPPPPIIQLSSAILMFRMRDVDPSGEYKIKAKVSDLNADISFQLERKFTLK
jgi:hypothetical protein